MIADYSAEPDCKNIKNEIAPRKIIKSSMLIKFLNLFELFYIILNVQSNRIVSKNRNIF
jgi:hypothetical protein